MAMRLTGLDDTLAALNKELGGIKDRSAGGLLEAGLFIQRKSQQRVPVEYGNLRGSAYTRKVPGNPLAVEVGYSAAYAVFVHENMEQKLKGIKRPSGLGVYWGPKGEPKFLERPVREHKADIVRIVGDHARKKGAA